MLRYLGLGKRHYGERPMPPHKRLNWEFLAVLRGKIAPYDEGGARPKPVADTFWLYPPDVVHGWAGVPGENCELVVIHYSRVPQAVEQVALRHGFLQIGLHAAEKQQLRAIATGLKRHYWRPTLKSEIHTERILMDLSLLILRDHGEPRHSKDNPGSYQKVNAAEDWLRAHLSENPAVADAAVAVGLSPSQLNRIFQRVRGKNPQDVLHRLKLDRAMELLGSTNAKLHSIASECGFSNASNLCRAFRAYKGHSPTRWREETFIQYQRSRESAAPNDPASHGRRRRPVR